MMRIAFVYFNNEGEKNPQSLLLKNFFTATNGIEFCK